jgi:hypothetical protein
MRSRLVALSASLALTCSLAVVVSACANDEPAETEYVDADIPGLPDATLNDGFRDGGDCPGGGSGGSGGNVSGGSGGSGGCPNPEPTVDAAPPCGDYTFSYTSATATTVYATGTFSNWSDKPPGALELVKNGETFSASKFLGPGKHVYKFVVDGKTWIPDPANPNTESDGFGGQNSYIILCE